ncbi:MAG: metal ABC transporter ATP-binding protein [Thermodesulfobacteria bacterium]|nr:metal ABC transporter ATP-binding protein [Thermodesulfobacteriota bacterium]
MSPNSKEGPGPDWVLEVSGLGVTLGRNKILENVNLTVRRGHIHALIGPNGAGKTTLMRSILGGMPHTGTIRFKFYGDGTIGYVPQFLDFDRAVPITVFDFIRLMLQDFPLFLSFKRGKREMIRKILEVTECDHLMDRMMGGLSGGEFRRVLLAQAVHPVPEILLLDEPASNMDEVGTNQFERLLLELRKKHDLSILMVGHDIRRILALCDHVTAINRTVIFDGKPDELRDPGKVAELFGLTTGADDLLGGAA